MCKKRPSLLQVCRRFTVLPHAVEMKVVPYWASSRFWQHFLKKKKILHYNILLDLIIIFVYNTVRIFFFFCVDLELLHLNVVLMLLFVFLETCRNKALENIASQDQRLEIQSYADKLAVIKEVLARRHMKVAFFGR